MPRLWTRILLFLSSYAPLFAILAFQSHSDRPTVAWGLAVIAIVAPIGLGLYVFYWLPRKNTILITPAQVSPKDGEAVSYFVFYLFPFLDVNFANAQDLISMGILLAVLLVIYINSNMMYVNPVLNLLGFHFFETRTNDGRVYGLISRDHYIRTDTSFQAHQSGNYIVLKKQ